MQHPIACTGFEDVVSEGTILRIELDVDHDPRLAELLGTLGVDASLNIEAVRVEGDRHRVDARLIPDLVSGRAERVAPRLLSKFTICLLLLVCRQLQTALQSKKKHEHNTRALKRSLHEIHQQARFCRKCLLFGYMGGQGYGGC